MTAATAPETPQDALCVACRTDECSRCRPPCHCPHGRAEAWSDNERTTLGEVATAADRPETPLDAPVSVQNPGAGVAGPPDRSERHAGPHDAEVPVPARDVLVQRVADTITWNIEITHPDGEWETRRVDNWDADEQDAYRSNGGFTEGNAAVQAVRRRKVAEAVLALLESGTAGVYLARDSELADVRAELRARSQACARLAAEVQRLTGCLADVRASSTAEVAEAWRAADERAAEVERLRGLPQELKPASHTDEHFDKEGTCDCDCWECSRAQTAGELVCICPGCNQQACGLHETEAGPA